MTIKGIIFDLDGVICHTDEFHYQAWKRLADRLGIAFDREDNNRLRGVSRMQSLEIILEKYLGSPLDEMAKTDLAAQKNDLYRASLTSMSSYDLSDEVRKTLDELRVKGLKLAIGSSSKNAPLILDQIGMGRYFDAISDGNNIRRSKPDPEVFLKAADMIEEKPSECLVVEDAMAGVAAGHAGGFTVACIGDAAEEKAGDYNLELFSDLLGIIKNLN